jgi:O-antigen/teichoic acid export membrane protein
MTACLSPEHDESTEPPVVAAGVSLRASMQWALAGKVVYAACQWAILIVLAKWLTKEAVGQFMLGLAITTPIMLFSNLELGPVQATDARRRFRLGHYLALRLIVNALALGAIAGLAYGGGYEEQTAVVVLIVGLAKAIEMLSDVYHALLQQHHRMDRVAWSMMLKGVLSVTAVAAWLWLGGGIVGAAAALAATWGLVLLGYDVVSPAWLRKIEPDYVDESAAPYWDWPTLATLAGQSLPLGVRVMLLTLTLYVPRYFVEYHLGEGALGIFGALTYVAVVSQVLSNAIALAAAPRLARHHALGELPAFRRLVLKMVGMSVLVGGAAVLVALVAGEPILRLLYQREYAEHADLFTWIMLGAALWCVVIMLVAAANAARCQVSQAMAGIAVVLATLGSSAILIPSHALTGAAVASIIGGAVGVVAFGAIFLSIGKRVGDAKTGTP